MKDPKDLEQLIERFIVRFHKGPVDLSDRIIANMLAKGLSAEIRKHALVTKKRR